MKKATLKAILNSTRTSKIKAIELMKSSDGAQLTNRELAKFMNRYGIRLSDI